MAKDENRDEDVISHFGGEWKVFNFLDDGQLEDIRRQFGAYVKPLPNGFLQGSPLAIADFGAGSGRWAHFLLPSAQQLWLVEPGIESFALLQERFGNKPNLKILNESVSKNSVPDACLDLAVCLGVLHHVPDTVQGIRDIYIKMKPGATFLCYLYYALENKPLAYRALWRFSNKVRLTISKLPYLPRRIVCELIAALIYFPLARISKLFTKVGISSKNVPLHHYENLTFYIMRNDAFDRFGTSLEQRFTKAQITTMIQEAGFDISTLVFSPEEPFWTFSVKKS